MHIDEFLGRFSEVSEESDGYLARCPAHGDSRPSLRIWVGSNRQARLSCRAGCETNDVRVAADLTWPDLFNVEGDAITVPAARPEAVGVGGIAGLRSWLDSLSLVQGAADYAAKRFGLDADTALSMGLRSHADAADGNRPDFVGATFARFPRLVVPLYGFDGVARGAQGRDISGKCPSRWVSLSNPAGARWSAYGVFRGGAGYGVTIVAEGPGDGLTAAALGYDAVAVRGASLAASPELIKELADGLRGSLVVIAGDSDSAGQSFNRRLAEGLGNQGIAVHALALQRGASDVTAWREADPASFAVAFHAAVKAAQPVAATREAERLAVDNSVSAATGAVSVSADQGHEAARILADMLERFGDMDAGNAHALVGWCGGRIRYATGLGFFVWNGRVWQQNALLVREECHRMAAALMLAGRIKEAKPFGTTSRIDDLMTELKAVPAVRVEADEFDARPDLLSFANGTVELRTGRLREHRKEDLITQCLSIEYQADAPAPRWTRFLEEIFPDNPDMPAYIQRLCGYGITGSTDEQCFAVLWGTGSNGKSILTDTMSTVFGEIAKTTPFATFEEKASGGIPNDIAALRAARLVMSSEGESGKPMSEGILKRASGKDKMTARFMRQEFFTFSPTFLIMLATNHKPQFRGQDEGLWRRVKLIPFTRFFAPHERDYSLDEKLRAEAAGIAAWAVAGAKAWFAGGLGDPESIRDATREYRETSDALADFFPGVIVRDASASMLGTDVYHAYRDWCEAEGLKTSEVWSRRALYSALAERKVVKTRSAKGQTLVGIRLADAAPAQNGPGIFGKDDA